MRKDSIAGSLLGILVFLIGIAILVVVAIKAYGLFTASLNPVQAKGGDMTTALGASVVRLIYQILLLMVLCIAGSLVAARGLHLYFVAGGVSSPRFLPAPEEKDSIE